MTIFHKRSSMIQSSDHSLQFMMVVVTPSLFYCILFTPFSFYPSSSSKSGHGGSLVSDFLSKRFHVQLANHDLIQSNPQQALLDTFNMFDSQCLTEMRRMQCRELKSNINKQPKSKGRITSSCLFCLWGFLSFYLCEFN